MLVTWSSTAVSLVNSGMLVTWSSTGVLSVNSGMLVTWSSTAVSLANSGMLVTWSSTAVSLVTSDLLVTWSSTGVSRGGFGVLGGVLKHSSSDEWNLIRELILSPTWLEGETESGTSGEIEVLLGFESPVLESALNHSVLAHERIEILLSSNNTLISLEDRSPSSLIEQV